MNESMSGCALYLIGGEQTAPDSDGDAECEERWTSSHDREVPAEIRYDDCQPIVGEQDKEDAFIHHQCDDTSIVICQSCIHSFVSWHWDLGANEFGRKLLGVGDYGITAGTLVSFGSPSHRRSDSDCASFSGSNYNVIHKEKESDPEIQINEITKLIASEFFHLKSQLVVHFG